LEIQVRPGGESNSAEAAFSFYDEDGIKLYSVEKPAHE
jgi:hypothetical protein